MHQAVGTVAEIRAPKCRLSMKVTFSSLCTELVTPCITPPTVKVLMAVPRNANANIEPMCWKKFFFFIE